MVPIERWPIGTSAEYINARQELLQAESDLCDQAERVAALRRALPSGATMSNYNFSESISDRDTQTSLADLAADGRSVVIHHLMFSENAKEPCPGCAMIVDGFNGISKHLDQYVNFAVVAKAPLSTLLPYARTRGWDTVRLLSSFGTTFNADMHVEKPDGKPGQNQMPGLSVFRQDSSNPDSPVVKHVWSQSAYLGKDTLRGLDLFTPLWNLLDTIPEGRGGFRLRNQYV